MSYVAGAPFTLTYYPNAGGVSYDPVSYGGNVTKLEIYSDSNETQLVQTVNGSTRTAPGAYAFSVAALPAGTYYTKVYWTPSTGGSQIIDSHNTFVVVAASGGFQQGSQSGAAVSPISSLFGISIAESYITPIEYQNAPTAVDIGQLVVAGTGTQESEELKRVIARACALIDTFCRQPLGANTLTEEQRALVKFGGWVSIRTLQFPIIAITSVEYQQDPTDTVMVPLVDLSKLVVYHNSFDVAPRAGVAACGRPLFSYSYVAGYPNTTLTGATIVGATSFNVKNPVGIYPGAILNIYDDANGAETVTVAQATGNTITVLSALQFAHSSGCSVSALPESVKQAAILLTSALIKTRGTEALVVASIAGPPQFQNVPKESRDNIAYAEQLLKPFKRVWT